MRKRQTCRCRAETARALAAAGRVGASGAQGAGAAGEAPHALHAVGHGVRLSCGDGKHCMPFLGRFSCLRLGSVVGLW